MLWGWQLAKHRRRRRVVAGFVIEFPALFALFGAINLRLDGWILAGLQRGPGVLINELFSHPASGGVCFCFCCLRRNASDASSLNRDIMRRARANANVSGDRHSPLIPR
uniref:Putative secreted peptide n=1 Tax=Anopheles braziliensis TaxID=58242 RepID=A0A2M3ZQM7_9DIPT